MPQKRRAENELPRPNKQQQPKESSTVRRRNLGNFIQVFGDTMPKACSNCRRLGLECKVHVKSGVCGKCHLSGSGTTCDVRVTQEEWSRLVAERARLLNEMKVALQAQKDAERAREEAEKARVASEKSRNDAIALESVLREELRKVEMEAEDAIAVEEAQIQALERHEAEQARLVEQEAQRSSNLALAPYTWSIEGGVTDDFWEPSESTPWVLT